MNKNQQPEWLEWAKELQFIAQAGLTYSKDAFDIERFERIREISAEIVSRQTGLPLEKVKDLFCNEEGFQTPKLDTRAAIFKANRILLVKEKNGTWSLPGGWVDVNQTIKSNTIKEVKEEIEAEIPSEFQSEILKPCAIGEDTSLTLFCKTNTDLPLSLIHISEPTRPY
mgnify:CR=1 FL=1